MLFRSAPSLSLTSVLRRRCTPTVKPRKPCSDLNLSIKIPLSAIISTEAQASGGAEAPIPLQRPPDPGGGSLSFVLASRSTTLSNPSKIEQPANCCSRYLIRRQGPAVTTPIGNYGEHLLILNADHCSLRNSGSMMLGEMFRSC